MGLIYYTLLNFPVDPGDGEATFFHVSLFVWGNMAMVSSSHQILFAVLVHHASLMFAGLNRELGDILSPTNSPWFVQMKLEKWRRNHALVGQMIDNINQGFGLMLLLSISSKSITCIALVFALFADSTLADEDKLWFAVTIVKEVFYLMLLVITPDHMRRQVRNHCTFI